MPDFTLEGTPTFTGSLCTIDATDLDFVGGPASLLSMTQGWFAVRCRFRWAGTTETVNRRLFSWRDFDPDGLELRFDAATNTLVMDDITAGSTASAGVTYEAAAETDHTIIGAWDGSSVKIALDGGDFSSNSRGTIGTNSDTVFSIFRYRQAATEWGNGDVHWLAMGSGTLTNADSDTFHAFGNTDPTWGALPGTPVLLWDATSATYLDSAPSGTGHTATPADGASAADEGSVAWTAARPSASQVGVVDLASIVWEAVRAAGDTVTAADVLARAVAAARTITDAASVADTLTRVLDATRSLADALTALDAATTSQGYARTISDAAGVADSANAQLIVPHFVTVNDTASVADAGAVAWTAARSSASNVQAADQAVTDHQGGGVGHTRNVTDAVAAADVAALAKTIALAVADLVAAADSLTPSGEGAQQLADLVQAADVFARVLEQQRVPAELVAVADQFARIVTALRSAADAVTVADQVTASVGHTLFIADGAGLTDFADVDHAVSGAWEVEPADPVLVDDLFDRLLTKGRNPVGRIGGGRSGIIVHGQHGAVTVTRGGLVTGGKGRIVQAREGSLA